MSLLPKVQVGLGRFFNLGLAVTLVEGMSCTQILRFNVGRTRRVDRTQNQRPQMQSDGSKGTVHRYCEMRPHNLIQDT